MGGHRNPTLRREQNGLKKDFGRASPLAEWRGRQPCRPARCRPERC
ncbi:hypothetical protein HMPREF0372_03285, partial [Flavonifractor plautii ATCC 29863]